VVDVKRGTFKVIRTDGTEQLIQERPSIRRISALIGAVTCDTVTLTRRGFRAAIMMICDDTGMVAGKPVNPKATELYHAVCYPGTIYAIHGDVAVAHDSDFI
jgi:hypothetical protein